MRTLRSSMIWQSRVYKLDMFAADAAIRVFLSIAANEIGLSPRTHSTSR